MVKTQKICFNLSLQPWGSKETESEVAKTLCSRNFQNVKLRLDFVEIDYFTATQILREIQLWQIQTVQKCHFCQI